MAEPKDDAGFDPYHKWLGIPKQHRPPTYYHLLGLTPGESDAEVIEEAAIRQSTHLRTYQVGPHAELCTKLLNEIGRARQVLLNPQKRAEYDRKLMAQSGAITAAPLAAPIVAAPVTPAEANPFAMDDDAASPAKKSSLERKSGKSPRRKDAKASKSGLNPLVLFGGGGVLLVLVIVVSLVIAFSGGTKNVPEKIVAEIPHPKEPIKPTPDPIKPSTPDPVKPLPDTVKPPNKPLPDTVKPPLDPVKPLDTQKKPPVVFPPPGSKVPPLVFKDPGDAIPLYSVRRIKQTEPIETLGGLRDGRVAIGMANLLRFYDLTTNRRITVEAKALAPSDVPQIVAPIAGDDSAIYLRPEARSVLRFRYKNEKIETVLKYDHGMEPLTLAAATTGPRFWIGGRNGNVAGMDANSLQPLHRIAAPPGDVTLIATPANGEFAAWVTGSKLNVAWDATKRSVGDMPPGFHPTLAVSPDGQHVLAGSPKGLHSTPAAALAEKEKVVWRSVNTDDLFRLLAFSNDGKYLLTAAEFYVYIWEWPSLKAVGRIRSADAPIKTLAVAPDSQVAYFGDAIGNLSIVAYGESAILAKNAAKAAAKDPLEKDPPPAKDPLAKAPPAKDPLPPPVVKVEVPAADKVAEASKKVREVFAKDFATAKKSAAERSALVDKLQRLARDTMDDPASRYALFLEARDLACQNNKWSAVAEILDACAAEYLVDRADQRLTALRQFLKLSTGKEPAEDACRAATDSIGECVQSDRFELAHGYLNFGAAAAIKAQSEPLKALVAKHKKDVEAVEQDFERMQKARAALAGGDNPAAHLDVGRYLALRKGDWDAGLMHLSKAGADPLAEAARKDVANPEDPKAQQDVGDSWWKLADKEKGTIRAALLSRAGVWYRQAAPKLTGLSLTVLNDRLKVIDEIPQPRPTNDLTESTHVKTHAGAVTALYVHDDGKRFFTSGADGFVRQWDVATGKPIAFLSFTSPIVAFDVSPDNRYLAAYDQKYVHVVSLAPPTKELSKHLSQSAPCWLDNNDLVFVNDGMSYLRSVEKKTTQSAAISSLPPRFGKPTSRQMIVPASPDLYVVDRAAKAPRAYKLDVPLTVCAALLPDKNGVVVGCSDKAVRKYVAEEGKLTANSTSYAGLGASPNCVAVSESGKRIAAGGNDKAIVVWDADTEKSIARFTQHNSPITALAFMPGERQIISASADGIVRIWNLPKDKGK